MEYKIVTFKINTKLYNLLKALKEVFTTTLLMLLAIPGAYVANLIYNLF